MPHFAEQRGSSASIPRAGRRDAARGRKKGCDKVAKYNFSDKTDKGKDKGKGAGMPMKPMPGMKHGKNCKGKGCKGCA